MRRSGLRRARLVAVAITVLGGTIFPSAVARAAVTFTAVQDGDWHDPATWGGSVPPLHADTVDVHIPSGINVILPAAQAVEFSDDSLYVSGNLFSGGNLLAGPGTLIKTEPGGQLFNHGLLDLTSYGNNQFLYTLLYNTGTFVNSGWVETDTGTADGNLPGIVSSGTFRNSGDVRLIAHGGFDNRGILENRDVLRFGYGPLDNSGTVTNAATGVISGGSFGSTGRIVNHGTIDSSVLNNFLTPSGAFGTLENFGTINVTHYAKNGGLLQNRSGAVLDAGATFKQAGTLVNDAGASINITGGTFENRALLDNYGAVDNASVFDNQGGVIRSRCNSSFVGNAVVGASPEDWCDTTNPILNAPSSIVVEAVAPAGTTVTYVARATDDKDPSPNLSCSDLSGATFPLGTTTVTCTATDYVGNVSTATFNVEVVDTTAPAITVLGSSTVMIVKDNSYIDAGATAIDAVDGDLTSELVVTNPVDVATPGLYTVTYSVEDSSGNAASATRTVEVVTPAEGTDRLIAHVEGLTISEKTRDDLLRFLTQGSRLLHDTNPQNDVGACELFDQFSRTINRHRDNGQLTSDQAAVLLDRAAAIETGVGCT